MMMNSLVNLSTFKAVDADPGATLTKFNDYCEEMTLLFQLAFRNAEGAQYAPSDAEKKAMLLLKGGQDMKNLFKNVGLVATGDTYDQAITKIKDELAKRTNQVVQRNMLLSNFPLGKKSFDRWHQEITNAARLIDYTNYDWKQASIDAILLQTSSSKLRECGLQDNVKFEDLIKLGIVKEQSVKGAALLEKASGGSSQPKVKLEEDVRRLQRGNRRLKQNQPDHKQKVQKDWSRRKPC